MERRIECWKNLSVRKTAGDEVSLLTSGSSAVMNGFFRVIGFVLSSCGYSFQFSLDLISILQQNVLILQFSVLNLALRKLNGVFL